MQNQIYHDTLLLAIASLSRIKPAPGENFLTARARIKRAVLSQIEVICEVARAEDDKELLAACERARASVGSAKGRGQDDPDAVPSAP